ncbi:MAG TPA: methylated-DNA--[protein]-cysteine S-methyltransferase [Sphingobacteriaceae bacterium]|nr:methylated-DNA--[protein]-cysteine S-methyltransferase [Sphingobacteriaceae bacterium]
MKAQQEMESQEVLNYRRIARAIEYIRTHVRQQPGLDEVAEYVGLSPAHFQRLFNEWAGVSPKKFLQFLTLQDAKQALRSEAQPTLFETTYEAGLSSTSRLHELFVNIEGMTPAEYKNGGRDLQINYELAGSPFGNVLVASTSKGVCFLGFLDEKGSSNQTFEQSQSMQDLKNLFPKASFVRQPDAFQQQVLSIFSRDWSAIPEIKLHLKGTPFQLKVWECLLKIPLGVTSTYGAIAESIGSPKAFRAVGTAVGSNPVSFLIPCHRVIRGDGGIGGYHWGTTRKRAILGWESARPEPL